MHLPECKYVPLQCPNLCGVTFERDFMEDHMKMCRLEEIGCEFGSVGCDGLFIREDQEEHTRQNSQKHLTLTASLAVETKEQLQLKLLEQDKKHKEEEEKLRQKIEEQEEKRLIEQEKMLNEHQKKLNEVEKRFQDQDRDHKDEKKMLKQILEEQGERQKELEQKFLKLSHHVVSFNRRFRMESFSKEKDVGVWYSPVMYTHVCGYKFCIGVHANVKAREKSVYMYLWGMPGEFDDQLKWPAKANFTIELVNPLGGENATCTTLVDIERPTTNHKFLAYIERIGGRAFLENSLLYKFLSNDTLHFHVSEIHLL